MDYLASCCRQQSENAASLLLQQYQWGKVHMLFTCVCGGGEWNEEEAGAYMTRRLLRWFRSLDPKKLAGNLEEGISSLAESLRECVLQTDLEWRARDMEGKKCADIAGVFCLEEKYLLIHRGRARIYLLNTAFGRGHARRLDGGEKGDGLETEQGVLQQDIGMLFATEPFYAQVTEKMLAEGLFVGETATEEQMEKHIRELAGEGERRGSKGIGAVFVKTVSLDFSE